MTSAPIPPIKRERDRLARAIKMGTAAVATRNALRATDVDMFGRAEKRGVLIGVWDEGEVRATFGSTIWEETAYEFYANIGTS